jgi:ribosomal protein S24E
VVLHPGEQTWCFEDLRTQIAEKYNVLDTRTIILKDFESKFGGGKSTGKCHMYFTVDDAIKAEPTAILQRVRILHIITNNK